MFEISVRRWGVWSDLTSPPLMGRACRSVPLGKVESTSGDLYPATYGAVCAAHDEATDACKGKYKAAWCNQKSRRAAAG